MHEIGSYAKSRLALQAALGGLGKNNLPLRVDGRKGKTSVAVVSTRLTQTHDRHVLRASFGLGDRLHGRQG
jgi:hypothetical protein